LKTDITLPGLSELSLAATAPCRQQLCTVLCSVASRLSDKKKASSWL